MNVSPGGGWGTDRGVCVWVGGGGVVRGRGGNFENLLKISYLTAHKFLSKIP